MAVRVCNISELSLVPSIYINAEHWASIYSKGRRLDSHRGQAAHFSSLPGVDIHSEP
jgi:hypothetical protein